MKLSAKTQLCCLIGHPVSHSLSPTMHNAAFEALGLDICYLAFDVPPASLSLAMEGLRALGAIGMSVTIPHKQSVRNFIDELDGDALLVGAVNCLAKRGPGWVGYNTDVRGFLVALEEVLETSISGMSAVVLGAGGAARAVAVSLGRAGASRVSVINRAGERAKLLVDGLQPHLEGTTFQAFAWDQAECGDALATADLLINATPLGMSAVAGSEAWTESLLTFQKLALTRLPAHTVFYDLIYAPERTPFMELALASGHSAHNGLGMLLHQGAESFRLWTRRDAPISIMRAAMASDGTS
ncbi:MAG: shikimate dehydrogenase [Myxococcales bacterium]|nr:shikimate dehydrogenase [Myxococcales bacterium]